MRQNRAQKVLFLTDRIALAIENARLHERERRSAREAATLLRLAEALVSTLHLSDRLQIIAQTLAEVAGCTRCLVFLSYEGALRPSCAHGVTLDELEAFGAMGVDLLRVDGPVRSAFQSGQMQVIEGGETTSASGRAFLDLWRIRSALAIPLVVGMQPIGAALLYTPGDARPLRPHDVRLCEAVANQAAIAIENARVFERERNVAEVLQRSFLPPAPEHLGTLRIAVRYHAALAEAEVGGDFYDIIDLPDGRVGLLMADVSGKGVAAAVHAAMGKYMLRAFAFEHPEPSDVLKRLNLALFTYSTHEVFITMFFAVIDMATGEVSYANAGHPPALLVRARDPNCMVRLGSTAPPVGAFRESDFATDTVHLEPGDLLVAYTDGVTEARAGQQFFGVERVEDVVAEVAPEGPDATADAIYATVRAFTRSDPHDDVALIVAKVLAD
jgi:serine phosphatase RsbU (regulator of sigma subunit)